MVLDPNVSQKIMEIESRILSLSSTGGDPSVVTRLTNNLNNIRSEIASRVESKSKEEESYWNSKISQLDSLNRDIDNNNNQAT